MDIVVLFDEPGLYLHSKAQNDIKKVFEDLAKQ
jgi:predicted ATP-dependent endonuclease of OLD family